MIKLSDRREPGLVLAIAGAGGISALARRLGLTQPSVSRWRRIPAERVVEIEGACGVPREFLRPDLYRQPEPVAVGAQLHRNGSIVLENPEA